MNPKRGIAIKARHDAAATQPSQYAAFVDICKFVKRVEINQSSSENVYSARDKRDGHEFLSSYGEGIKVKYGKRKSGRPAVEFIRGKDVHFSNTTEFAFEVYRCLKEIDAEPTVSPTQARASHLL